MDLCYILLQAFLQTAATPVGKTNVSILLKAVTLDN